MSKHCHQIIDERWLKHFKPMFHVYTPWKHHKASGFSNIFQGYRHGALNQNGLKSLLEAISQNGHT